MCWMTELQGAEDGHLARQSWRERMVIALLAGSVAIAVNTGLLALADALGFTTSRGGLLRLVRDLIAGVSTEAGAVLAPLVSSAAFQTLFHIVVGLLMAIFYAFVLELVMAGPAWLRGFLYAAGAWLLNAFVVLPLIGEGIAGSGHLGIAGIVGFAVIHTVFFVLLALLFAQFEERRAIRSTRS
jgi:small-conductance mechanosensitive channel